MSGGANWKVYEATTSNGYDVKLFHIIGDESGADFVDTKGPILMIGGVYSDALDFISRDDDL